MIVKFSGRKSNVFIDKDVFVCFKKFLVKKMYSVFFLYFVIHILLYIFFFPCIQIYIIQIKNLFGIFFIEFFFSLKKSATFLHKKSIFFFHIIKRIHFTILFIICAKYFFDCTVFCQIRYNHFSAYHKVSSSLQIREFHRIFL